MNRIPWWVLAALIAWMAGLIPCVEWCPPEWLRAVFLLYGLPWPWCCE